MSEKAKIEKALGLASGALAQADALAALSTARVQPAGPGAVQAQIEHQLSLPTGSLVRSQLAQLGGDLEALKVEIQTRTESRGRIEIAMGLTPRSLSA